MTGKDRTFTGVSSLTFPHCLRRDAADYVSCIDLCIGLADRRVCGPAKPESSLPSSISADLASWRLGVLVHTGGIDYLSIFPPSFSSFSHPHDRDTLRM